MWCWKTLNKRKRKVRTTATVQSRTCQKWKCRNYPPEIVKDEEGKKEDIPPEMEKLEDVKSHGNPGRY